MRREVSARIAFDLLDGADGGKFMSELLLGFSGSVSTSSREVIRAALLLIT